MSESTFTAKITSKRQITLPKGLCDRLGLREGDRVTFVEEEEGIRLEKDLEDSPFREWYGYLSHLEGTSDEIFEEIRGPDPVDELEGSARDG